MAMENTGFSVLRAQGMRVAIYFALRQSMFRPSFSRYWKYYKKLLGTDFHEIFLSSRFLEPLIPKNQKIENSWGILQFWGFPGFCVSEAPKISKMKKILKNLFPTIFYNVFNPSKTMLKVPIAAAQSRLPPLFLGLQNRKFSIFSIVIPIVANCMESIGFHWNSARGGGFGLLSAARRAGDGREHFLSVPGVIKTHQETSRVHISLRIGRSELTCLKWTTKGDTYCSLSE